MLAGIVPLGHDRKSVFSYQAFYIRWTLSCMKAQEVMTDLIRNRIIDLIGVLVFTLLNNDHMSSDDGAEIVQN